MLKKSLSQHLIKDRNVTDKMVRLAGISSDDVVVEIGAGDGHLTKSLVNKAGFVYAVEVDREFIPGLLELEHVHKNLRVISGDFLEMPFSEFTKDGNIKVIGNIPYKITAPIILKILEGREVVESAYVTMQAEVARRIVSKPFTKTYGGLSVVCQLLADVAIVFYLKASVFFPPPKVESAFVGIIPKEGKRTTDGALIQFIRVCFRNRRKHLKYALSREYGVDIVNGLYEFMKFSPAVRAEELEPAKFEEMFYFLRRYSGPVCREDGEAGTFARRGA
ncbi:16S rRNA (adenine(1518)-N(6)/adenine(1519)-N(6))-dimethyltransferase RsmA [Syntrophorhabdus aromaticivorans]|uniref:Ribosomal RNA small subunit methyltransferase A n=1 Tax=Syntrophorhabdus aromaticivorans TaxID=328301 RepID=A0A351U7L5_9BACT|nr:16S rRNA (adenine(1518)-N(6)/adenine(1519)-N(6))-dimethyltransferase RsmA [Syntrophorhabdus aromaticivorans]NLW35130.1 ribosomal RNA small subunit methyltransferase A [Syntrophorhabdus aromaticivorans]HBA55946.1 ribosomal RNA small subunit methyltransferase A [Syntrophorhabdus aromaticivorans]